MVRSKIYLVLFVSALLFSLILGASEISLRQCKNTDCGKYALSESWNYCPFCGTRLEEVNRDNEMGFTGDELVIGNIYKNKKFAFQIERPNKNWEFITLSNGLKDINMDATVGFKSENDTYGLIIAERIPDADLAALSELTAPDIDDRVMVSRKEITLNGSEALRAIWTGSSQTIDFKFYKTLVKEGDLFFQLVFWHAGNITTKTELAEMEAIEKSFRIISNTEKK